MSHFDGVDFNKLARDLRSEHEALSRFITDPAVTSERLGEGLLKGAMIFRFCKLLPRRPVVFCAGIGVAGDGVMLTLNPEGFRALVEGDPGAVETAADALSMLDLFLESTRHQNARLALMEGAEALPWRPNLDDAERARRNEVIERLGAQMPPNIASQEGGRFEIACYLVEGMDLKSSVFVVEPSGAVYEHEERTLVETGLPFTYTI